MLEDSGQEGTLEYDIFKIKVNKLVDYGANLIEIKNPWYKLKQL